MSIEVNATEQIIEVNATDTSIDINITNQVVDVNATTSVINVDASNGPGPQGPQGPAGQGVPVGGTTNQVLAKASGANYDTQWVNVGIGSVTSVDASGGVGISVTGGPIVSSGTFTITNTAPDQVVSITGSGGTSVTGTYPNFTISSNNLSGFVPYTGATQNVDLGEYEIKAGQFTLDTSPTGTATVGTTRWNNNIGSTETTLKGGNVVLKNGVDLVARVVNKVFPNATLTKAQYQAVRVTGAQGQRLAVAYAQANNDNNSADTIGLVTETIPTNQEGFIMTVGQLEGINTTGSLQGETWSDGDVLYLSPTTPGALTNVKPVAPQHLVVIGYVEYAHAINGKIYVKVMNGWELGELHDVNTTGAVAGNVLKYNGTIWTPSSDIDTGITSLNGLTALSQTFATGTSGTDFNISSSTSTHTFNLPTASATNRGLLSTTDWSTFNNKQNALGYTPVPTTRTLTINGNAFDLSADRSWSVGTVTSIDMSVPTGFAISGNPITSSGTLALAFAAGYSLPTTSSQANWDAAYNDKINSASVTGTTTKTLTLTQQDGGTITASWTDDNTDAVTSVFGRTGAVVAQSGDYTTTQVTEGTNLYYTEARVSANTDVAANTAARHNAVTLGTANGLSLSTQQLSLALASGSTTGALSSTDWTTFNNKENAITAGTTLQYFRGDKTFQTLNTSVVPESGNLYYTDARSRAALSFVAGSGAYNSMTGVITIPTNTNQLTNGASFITLASLSGGAGISYNNTTGVIASTITQYTDAMARASISGGTGISYNSTTGVITNTITQYTDAMARASLSFVAGSGAYNSTTGVITIPTNTNQLTNGAAFITLGSLSASAPLSYNNGTGAFTISQASSTTNGFLSSTDWNTFNNKQNALTNPVTGTGTTNYVTKWTSSSAVGNSLIYDDGSSVGIGTTSFGGAKLAIQGGSILVRTDGDILKVNDVADSTYWFRFTRNASNLEISNRQAGALVFLTSDVERMRITSIGNVGIGTTSPQANLHIQSTQASMNMRSTGTGSPYIDFYTSSTSLVGNFYALNGGGLAWGTSGGTERMRLDNSGNLGLGVTPSAWNSSFNVIQIGSTGSIYSRTSGTEQMGMASNAYFASGTNDWRYITSTNASYYLQSSGIHYWLTAASGTAGNAITFTQAMTLNASGNLSIGNTNDTYKLDVSGTGRFSGDVRVGLGNALESLLIINGQTYSGLRFERAGTTKWAIFNNNAGTDFIDFYSYTTNTSLFKIAPTGAATFSSSVTVGSDIFLNYDYAIRFKNSSGTYRQIFAYADDTYLDARDGGILMRTGTGGSATERLRITSGGNVGIGTSSPATDFQVVRSGSVTGRFSNTATSVNTEIGVSGGLGYVGTQSANAFGIITSDTERVRITSSGSVGIGTTNPITTLQVNATSPAIRLQETGSGGDKRLELSVNSSGVATVAANQSAQVLTFETVGSERMRIAANGNVGIGTTSPSQKLDVSGNIQVTGAGNWFRYDTYGYFGSGSVSGGATTDVAVRSENNLLFSAGGATERMRITGGGEVILNNSASSADVTILRMNGGGSGYPVLRFSTGGTLQSQIYSYANTLFFDTNGSERGRITSGGNLLVGTTTDSGERLVVNGDAAILVDLKLKRTSVSPAIVLSQSQVRLVDESTGYTNSIYTENNKIRFSNAIQTAGPGGSSAGSWKLGTAQSGTVTTNRYITIEIDGQTYTFNALLGTP